MVNTYKDLIFWQRSHEVSLLLIRLCRMLSREKVTDILASQVIRSAFSVGANIAEGYGRYKSKEYGRFLQIAIGSANETDYWLLLLKESFPSLSKDIDIIINKNLETLRMLTKTIKTIKNKKD